jgi:predicted component of type VI protein secretion system
MTTAIATGARWLAELRAHPTHHDLVAAFDLLQKISCGPTHLSQSAGDLPPRHLSQSAGDLPPREPVRFTHSTDLALPLGELLAITADPDDPARHLLTTAGPGPCGPASPLPLALADELADDPLALAVLDLFHHRRTLLLCRGLLAADLAGSLDTHNLDTHNLDTRNLDTHNLDTHNLDTHNLDTRTAGDPWTRRIIALVGLSTSSLTPLEALRLAPVLASAERSPRALALALRRLLPALCPDHADASALRCELTADAWTPLADEHHSRLGGPAARLGDTAALGTALRLPSAAARLHLGPLPATALPALRPGGPLHARLCALLAIFIPDPLALDLIVELDDLSLPPCRLGQQTLGRDLFLTPDPAARRSHRLTIPLTA